MSLTAYSEQKRNYFTVQLFADAVRNCLKYAAGTFLWQQLEADSASGVKGTYIGVVI